jgi:hypothetical protein
MFDKKSNRPFFYLTFSVIILLVFPILIKNGMFMDGQQYACVAKNLAHEKGSFWFPFLSETWLMVGYPYFMEQPPLFFELESYAFKLFGDSMYTERIFCAFALLLNCVFILKIWNLVVNDDDGISKLGWYPLLLWIVCPVCFWVFQNNMIEMVVSFFALGAVYYALKIVSTERINFFYIVMSSIFVVLGFLTKGLPALFPLVTIPLYYFVTKEIAFKKSFIAFLLTLFITIVFFGLLVLLNDDAKMSLRYYFFERLLSRVDHAPTVDFRLFTLISLIQDIIVPFSIAILVVLLSRNRLSKSIFKNDFYKNFVFFSLLGCVASLPLMLTMVQKNFYYMPALPYFAIAIALYSLKYVKIIYVEIVSNNGLFRKFRFTSISLLITGLLVTAFQIGTYSRDETIIKDVNRIGGYVGKGKIVSTDVDTYYNWSFHFYLLRYHDISLDPRTKDNLFFVTVNNDQSKLPEIAKKVEIPTTDYQLYKIN